MRYSAELSTWLLPLFSWLACTAPQPPPKPVDSPPVSSVASLGTSDPHLAALLDRHWEYTMSHNPVWATTLADRRFDARIGDTSRRAILEDRSERQIWLSQARQVRASPLDPADQTTLALLVARLEADAANEVCEFEQWNLSAMQNPITLWNALPKRHLIKSALDALNFLARVESIGYSIDNTVSNLALGAAKGMFATKETTERVIAMVEAQLEQSTGAWPLLAPALRPIPGWGATQAEKFAVKLRQALEQGVRPALRRYADFLKTEVLPKARGATASGLSALPQGPACYRACIQRHVGLARTAEEIHATGVAEIARIDDEIRDLGFRLFGSRDLPTILRTLRSDATLYFADAAQVEAKARAALAVAKRRMPQYFGRLPKAGCVVEPMPAYEAPFSAIAYYRPPFPDGSKPGEYIINTSQASSRPRYEAEALAYHEAIPGHHLQLAIAQELRALPAFRKHGGTTAFVEGWALYSERLADEMGLYSTDLDRMGMLSFEAWRAARLVVDTGIHALGWSRERAVAYMLEHTALAENNVRNEVDRYISWPGQALAYKLGQLHIASLRALAESGLAENFDIRKFHDVVLSGGAVSLPVLERQVREWIASGG